MLVSNIVFHLPDVLDSKQKSALAKSIQSLDGGENIDYSSYFETRQTLPADKLSQGDAYEGLPYIRLPIKKLPLTEVPLRPSMILSNSCAISPGNSKALPSRVIYAPIIRLDKLEALINQKSPQSVQLIEDIRKQQPMNYFYLPAHTGRYPESVVLFDNMLSIDSDVFGEQDLQSNIRYRLSRDAWYHLLIKLSAYFTRATDELVTERT